MTQQPPASRAIGALTSSQVFSALTGVALGIVIFLVGAWSMGFFTKLTDEEMARQAIDASLPDGMRIAQNEAYLESHGKDQGYTVTASGLRYKVLKPGSGAKPASAEATVKVNYKGKFINGTVFDSTEGGEPAEFALNQVVAGWTEALQLMKTGEKAEFVIPYDLAYGASGRGPQMPPYQTLIFEIELLEVK